MIIKVRKEVKFGRPHVYPVCETALLLLEFVNGNNYKDCVTFTPRQIVTLKRLGYELQIEAETL